MTFGNSFVVVSTTMKRRRVLQKGRGLSSILRVIGRTVAGAVKASAPVLRSVATKVTPAVKKLVKSQSGRQASKKILSAAIESVTNRSSVSRKKTGNRLKGDLLRIARSAALKKLNGAKTKGAKNKKKKNKGRGGRGGGGGGKRKKKSTIWDH